MKYLYKEAGAGAIVEVLSDKTDDEGMRVVKLKTLEHLSQSKYFGALPDGEWEVSAQKVYEAYIGWTLREHKA